MKWKLNQAEDVECTLDDSGVYTVINRQKKMEIVKQNYVERVTIRGDIFSKNPNNNGDDIALQSFEGEGNAVRKAVIKWLSHFYLDAEDNEYSKIGHCISTEQGSSIGYEIARDMLDKHYVQS